MRTKLFLLNSVLLLLCCSIYLGTGWSLVLFNFSVVDQLTPENYYIAFVPQIEAATQFFTALTYLMIVSASVMIWYERKTSYKWWPIITLIGVILTGWFTREYIFPYNDQMRAGIADSTELKNVLETWTQLAKIRLAGWTINWFAMAIYFALLVYRTKTIDDQNNG